jgi:fucose 4-O-acetylase-like acetyltransferase
MCSIPFVIPFLSMFHMPLFFVAAGYCFNDKYLTMPLAFLKRRLKRLYVPFVKWGLVFALLRPLFFTLHIYDTTYGFNGVGAVKGNWLDILHSCWIIVTQMRGTDWLLGGYWFLNAAFFGSIIAWVTRHLIRKVEYTLITLIALLVVVHVTNFHITFLNINTRAFAAAVIYIAGSVLNLKKVPLFGPVGITASLALTALGMFYWPLAIDNISYDGWQLFPHILTAILATWSFYSLFTRYINGETTSRLKRFFLFIGENTLSILTWHLLSFKLASLIIILIYGLPIEQLGEFPVIMEYSIKGWWLLYFLVGVGLPLATTKVIDFLLQGKQSTR